jgi:hypothetical protein
MTRFRSSQTLTVILAIIGNAVLIILSLLWLQIPDGRVWQVGLSFILAIFIVLAFLWLQTYTLRGCAEERSARISVGMLVFAILLVVAYLLLRPVSMLEDNAAAISYFWNSKLPASFRYSLPQPRIYHLLTVAVAVLHYWILPGLLLPFAAAAAAYRSPARGLRAAVRTLLRWRYWLLLGVDFAIAYEVTRNITAWHPGHTPRAQIISLIARTIVAYLVCVGAWLVAIRVACVRLGRCCRGIAPTVGDDEASGEHARGNA